MSRRKKTIASLNDAPAKKKQKMAVPKIGDFEVRFEWQGDDSKWICFTREFNELLTDAYNAGKKQVDLVLPNGTKLTVKFDKMIQVNKETRYERRIRVALKSEGSSDFRVLEWQEDSTTWSPYSVKFSSELEEAFLAGQDLVTIKALPSTYEMDLKKMTQTNVKTKFSRPFRRDIPVSDVPPDDENSKKGSDEAEEEIKKETKKSGGTKGRSGGRSKKASNNGEGTSKSTVSDVPPDDENNEKGSDEAEEEIKKETKKSGGTKGRSGGRSKKASNNGEGTSKSTVSDVPPDDENSKKDSDEAEEEIKKETKKSGGTKGRSGGRSKKASNNGEGTSKSTVKTVVVKKGSAPVDDQCPVASRCHVYEAAKVVWDCMLNQTNISNNNNKYYLIQLLQESGKDNFHVWQRWGRVGYKGQTNLVKCDDLDSAVNAFTKKFREKTGNDWSAKDHFVKVSGKYDLLKMDYSAEGEVDEVDKPSAESEKVGERKVPDSKLDKRVQDLIQLICDVKSMEDAVVEMKYDAKKAPLGKLTKEQIKAGYEALKDIESLIEKKDFGRNLSDACSEFYTRIPHEFGMQIPPLIRTPQMVKEKIALLEALEDIEIAIKLLKGGDMSENPIDRHYHQLHCNLDPVDHGSEDFKLVNKYLQQTHASTHNQYKMELVDVFACDKEGETANFQDYGNRMLLWHGSRLSNWAGILGQGLRIAPPEAPVTGYMFGKGVYFADMSSKSANYCFATKKKNIGLLLLCDVSLGSMNDKMAADYHADKLPEGKQSVRGVGKVVPDPASKITLDDGLVVPVGKGKDTGGNNLSLIYNEYIVYDVRQIRMKYLVLTKFIFK